MVVPQNNDHVIEGKADKACHESYRIPEGRLQKELVYDYVDYQCEGHSRCKEVIVRTTIRIVSTLDTLIIKLIE